MRGLFVTGTDTGAGKSIVAAAICAALVQGGERVAAFKPVVTGLQEPRDRERGDGQPRDGDPRDGERADEEPREEWPRDGEPLAREPPDEWPPDHELLAAQTGQRPDQVTPHTFEAPLSPHLAAELAGVVLEPRAMVAAARAAGSDADALVCEGVGGLLVPLTANYVVRDLATELGLPVVITARAGLGTINHTLLTVEAARAAALTVAGVVMTPWPVEPDRLSASNRATVERLAEVTVSTLPATRAEELGAAGAGLPLASWLR